MNWEALGAVAELLGAAAVVVSMLFLAQQIRESNRVAKAEAIRARGERMVDIWFRVAESPALSEATNAAFFDEAPLPTLPLDQQRRFHMIMRPLCFLWESEYMEHVHGALDEAVWDRRLNSIAAMLQKPAYGAVWSDVRGLLTTGFVREVEAARAAISAAPDLSSPAGE